MNSKMIRASAVTFRKEMQESAKWAVIATVGLAIGMFCAAEQGSLTDLRVWNGINLAISLGAPLIGIGFGILQILPEKARDRWAFLVHRPASPASLFAGKACAGLCLTILTVLIPYFAAVMWAAAPGHVAAPFDRHLMEAGLASAATSIPFYFAGLVVALRPARWYGSRLMPIPAAILASLVTNFAVAFWDALAASALMTLLIAMAAGDTFRSTSDSQSPRSLGRASLGTALFLGFGISWIVAIMMAVAVISSFQHHSGGTEYSYYSVTQDGQIVILTNSGAGSLVNATYLNGRPVSEEELSLLMKGVDTMGTALAVYTSTPNGVSYRNASTYVKGGFDDWREMQNTSWYLTRSGMIVGYSNDTCEVIGAVGTGGFDTNINRVLPFKGIRDIENSEPTVIPTENAIYLVDMTDGIVKTLIVGSQARQAVRISSVFDRQTSRPGDMVVTTPSMLYLYTGSGDSICSLPLQYGQQGHWQVNVGITRKNDIVLHYQLYGKTSGHLFVYSRNGALLKSTVLPDIPSASQRNNPPPLLYALPGVAVPPWVVITAATIGFYVTQGPEAVHEDFADIGKSMVKRDLAAYFLGGTIAGLVCALITWLLARRSGLTKRGVAHWVVGNFFLSWPGIFVMIAMSPWPAREKCAKCGRIRVVSRERCEYCAAGWPPPALDGTEIFGGPRNESAAILEMSGEKSR